MLGCPNLPQKRIDDADGADESASKAGTDGIGVIFAAERGQGALAGPLFGALPPRGKINTMQHSCTLSLHDHPVEAVTLLHVTYRKSTTDL